MVDGQRRATTFSVGTPNKPDLLVPFAREAERLGFAGAWTQDTVGARNFTLDGLHVLSYLASVTERMRLGISVLYSGRRNPAVQARELATIDHLSNGRLVVGLGVGNDYHRAALEAVGVPMDRPVRRLVEGIEVMRALWRDEEASYHGQLYSFSGVRSQPKPVQRPGPPIWIGARSAPALRRAVRIADGWTGAGPVSTAEFLDQLAVVDEALAEQGRDRSSFAVSKGVYLAVEDDIATARERLLPIFERSYGANPVYSVADMTERVAVFGPAEHCAERLRELVDAGVDELILHPLYDELGQLDRFAEVLDALAQR